MVTFEFLDYGEKLFDLIRNFTIQDSIQFNSK